MNAVWRADEKAMYVLPSPFELKSSLATSSECTIHELKFKESYMRNHNKTAAFSIQERSAKDKNTEVGGRYSLSEPLKANTSVCGSSPPTCHNSKGSNELGHEDYVIPLCKSNPLHASTTSLNINTSYPVSSPLIFELHKLPSPPNPPPP